MNRSRVTDLNRLKRITRKALRKLDKSFDQDILMESALTGKASLAATLVMLAELTLRLDEASAEPEALPALSGAALAASDIALVEAFVHKMQASAATSL